MCFRGLEIAHETRIASDPAKSAGEISGSDILNFAGLTLDEEDSIWSEINKNTETKSEDKISEKTSARENISGKNEDDQSLPFDVDEEETPVVGGVFIQILLNLNW